MKILTEEEEKLASVLHSRLKFYQEKYETGNVIYEYAYDCMIAMQYCISDISNHLFSKPENKRELFIKKCTEGDDNNEPQRRNNTVLSV